LNPQSPFGQFWFLSQQAEVSKPPPSNGSVILRVCFDTRSKIGPLQADIISGTTTLRKISFGGYNFADTENFEVLTQALKDISKSIIFIECLEWNFLTISFKTWLVLSMNSIGK